MGTLVSDLGAGFSGILTLNNINLKWGEKNNKKTKNKIKNKTKQNKPEFFYLNIPIGQAGQNMDALPHQQRRHFPGTATLPPPLLSRVALDGGHGVIGVL
jgi:hypothetical protein